MIRRSALIVVLLLVLAAGTAAQPPAPQLPPPGSLVTPPAPPNPPGAPAQPASPSAAPDQGRAAELSGPTELALEARPALVHAGQSSWDDGFDTLTEAFRKLRAEAQRIGLKTVGPPQAAFTSTDDHGFRFEAMLVLESPPAEPKPKTEAGFAFGASPAGRTLMFTHEGAYDDIDTTYEAITAFLDEKGLKARNIFVEEYVTEPKTSDDPSLKMNILVLIE